MKRNRHSAKRSSTRNFNIPKEVIKASYSKSVLANGLTVISEHIPGVESIAVGVHINAGSRDDLPGKEGTAHFMEHIAYRHTKTKNSRQIAEGFESVGAFTNAFTTQEHICFYVRSLQKHFKKTMRLLADITLNPIFRNKDIEKERSVIIEEIKSTLDDPEEVLPEEADKLIFGSHPLGNPITGHINSVKNIKYEDLLLFHENFFVPENIVITAAGNIEHTKIVDLAEKLFFGLKPGTSNRSKQLPGDIKQKDKTIYKNTNQSHLLLGKKISRFDSDERYCIMLLNTMLGEGMSSRLYQKLREQKALTYNIYSSLNYYTDCGTLYIYTSSERENLKYTEKLIFTEFKKLTEKISAAHLKKAKEQLKSQIIMELENLSNLMISLAKDEFMLGENEDISTIVQEINNVSIEKITKTANKYLNNDNWFKCVILPKDNN